MRIPKAIPKFRKTLFQKKKDNDTPNQGIR